VRVQLPIRLTKSWQKLLYIVGGYAIVALLLLLIRSVWLDWLDWPYELVQGVLTFAWVLGAARTFRGRFEPLDPRDWWRWTAKPTAGFWLAGGFLALAIIPVITLASDSKGQQETTSALVIQSLCAAIVAAGFLNSSIQLRRHPELAPPAVA
jgi:hypothetical protein